MNGVYVATRGIADTWDTHFRSQSYTLLQRLIRNLLLQRPQLDKFKSITTVAPNFVDPNRVYILGFSAGGDGVYRLASVLSDRFAAANMSAGHPGKAKLINLANVPICLQMGEGDSAWGRNTSIVTAGKELKRYRHGKYYINDIFIHFTPVSAGDPHNSWERTEELTNIEAPVIRDWENFTGAGSVLTREMRNTCAVLWMSEYIRNPLPKTVVWDMSTSEAPPEFPAEWGKYRYYYWLAVEQNPTDSKGTTVRATYDKVRNEVWIGETSNLLTKFIVLLNEYMMDLRQPVNVIYGPQRKVTQSVTVTRDGNIQKATLSARGDPFYVFSAAIVVDLKDPKLMTVKDGGSDIFSTVPKAKL
ncbi:MAG: hypothetical protein Q9157_007090 [Trypethelium eluteriae]